MYTIQFDDEVIEFLGKLPKEISRRIYDKIISTKKDPFHFFERLKGRNEYKLRVGDYRLIADIKQDKKTIDVVLIGHRKNVYQKV